MTEGDALVVLLPDYRAQPVERAAHWSVDAERARRQRDAVCAAVLAALNRRRIIAPPTRPKVH